jgi:DNA replication and repair protein RecF
VLKQRNATLKHAQSKDSVLAWTSLLVEYARPIWGMRSEFVGFLDEHVGRLYQELFFEERNIRVSLTLGAPSVDSLGELLDESWEYEKKYKHTIYGPHRDDLVVTVDGFSADTVLSRGQMRGLVISLKVASRAFIEQRTGQSPILLFDEILSELDPMRQETLLHHLPGAQTILTCTSIPDAIRVKSDVSIIDIRTLVNSPALV